MNRHTCLFAVKDCRDRRRAFTLAELIMVIFIIGVLIALLVPAVLAARTSFLVSKTEALISALDGACGMYYNDYSDYPPSRPTGFTTSPDSLGGWQGYELLPLFLIGYGMDAGRDNVPATPIRLLSDDGQDGYGVRAVARGPVRGPYNGAERQRMIRDGAGHAMFTDPFGNRVLYYRCDVDKVNLTYSYTAADNTLSVSDPDGMFKYDSNPKTVWPGPQTAFDLYTGNGDDPKRKDFLLFTAGPDRIYTPAVNTSGLIGDDVTNLAERQAVFSNVQ